MIASILGDEWSKRIRGLSMQQTILSCWCMLPSFLTVDVVFRLLPELGRTCIQWKVIRAFRVSYCYTKTAFTNTPFFSHTILLFAPFTPVSKGTQFIQFLYFLKLLPCESNGFILTCPQCSLEYGVVGTAKLVINGSASLPASKIFLAIVSFIFLPVLEDLCFKQISLL